MPALLDALCFGANDPRRLANFWAAMLGRELADTRDGITLVPGEDTAFRLRFLPTQTTKVGRNRMHLHLTSTSLDDQQSTVARAVASGARHLDVGQLSEERHVVLADPEGNEFCVIEPNNSFLAGCGYLGELACDGSRETGRFWSAALGWPLVWDQDEETAIQSPAGGTKLAWGGPPLMPSTGSDRLRLDLAPVAESDLQAEVDRLVSLGARTVDTGQDGAASVMLGDPDGNEFRILAPQE